MNAEILSSRGGQTPDVPVEEVDGSLSEELEGGHDTPVTPPVVDGAPGEKLEGGHDTLVTHTIVNEMFATD